MIIASGTKVINDYDTLEAVDTANEAKESASKELVAMEHATIDEETGNIAIFGRDAEGNITSEMDLTSRGMGLYDSGEQVASFSGNKIELGKTGKGITVSSSTSTSVLNRGYIEKADANADENILDVSARDAVKFTGDARLNLSASEHFADARTVSHTVTEDDKSLESGVWSEGASAEYIEGDYVDGIGNISILMARYGDIPSQTWLEKASVAVKAGANTSEVDIEADRLTFNDKPMFKVAAATTTSRSWAAKGTALGQYNYKPDTIAGYTAIGLIGACSNSTNVTVSAYYDGSIVRGHAYNHNTSAVSTSLVLRFLYVADGLV